MQEIVEQMNIGFTFDPDSPEELKDALVLGLNSYPGSLTRWQQVSERLKANYGSSVYMSAIAAVYQRLGEAQ